MNLIRWFLHTSLLIKLVLFVIIGGVAWYTIPKILSSNTQKTQYQTTQVQKGTLIVSISSSGQVSTANNASVTTDASGVVKNVFVKNGDEIKTGDKIAEIDLDMQGKQRSTQSYASYQSAKNNLDSSKASLYTAQSTMLTKWKSYMDLAQSSNYQNSDLSPRSDQRNLPQYMSPQDDWLASEAQYKIQQNAITQAETTLSSSWMTYQKSSPVIYAPISGKVIGISLQVGSVINTTSNTSGTLVSQKIASIQTSATPTVQLNLTEIDVPKVHIGDKATLTFDAFSGKTFTGKVVSIDTTGAVSSGVTTYPVVIKLDTAVDGLYTNMSAQANIITQTKDNVLLILNSTIQTSNGVSSVRVLKNGQVENVTVETGIASSSQIEITSGLSEGDALVTGSTTTRSSSTTQSGSVFSALRGGVGGGGNFRIGGR